MSTGAPQAERPGRFAWLGSLLDDPILLKELRAAFRRTRFFWLQTGLLALVALIVLITMWALTDDFRRDPSEIGRRTFLIFAMLELGLIFFIFPAFACTSITDERTNKSLDLLLTTNLSPSRIVLGKTLASFVYGLQFIIATLPLVALTFLYGGVTPGQIVLAYAVMVVIAGVITVHALSVSSAAPSTLRAVLSTYMGVVLIVLPLVAPLITTSPVAAADTGKWGGGEANNGILSGILAVHVLGPLQKDASLLKLREEVRNFDLFTSVLYWGGHLFFYASAVWLFFLIARHRLAPSATNRSTPLKAWFSVTLAVFLGGTLAGFLHLEPWRVGTETLVTIELALFFVLCGAAISFAGEDPPVPRRLRAAFEAAKGLRAPLRVFFPGGANGMRFVLWAALLAHGAVVLVFLGSIGRLPTETNMRPPVTILLWGSAWGFLFVVFVAEIAYILSCELRHEVASRACAAIAVIAIALGPFLWYVLEYPEKRPYPYKGYWASPVTVALSVLTTPMRDTERQLYVLGPSGYDIRMCKEAVERRLLDFLAPPGDRNTGDPVARTKKELVEKGVDDETIQLALAEVARVIPLVPKEPGTITDDLMTLREDSRKRLMSQLTARGVPVHEVSTFVYLGVVALLGIVIRKRYMRFSA
ncbi:MAG: ABC transporter permease [Planctomycetota bacterium]